MITDLTFCKLQFSFYNMVEEIRYVRTLISTSGKNQTNFTQEIL